MDQRSASDNSRIVVVICGIYKITNLINSKVYIGRSTNVLKRWTQHRYKLLNGVHYNPHLQSAFDTHGEINFTYEIIEECTKDELNQKEIFWIAQFNSQCNDVGYNKSEGGHAGGGARNKGKTHSPECRARISKSLKGRKMSEITKSRIGKANSGIKQKILTCNYCLTEGGTTMHRWHFDRCRYRSNVEVRV